PDSGDWEIIRKKARRKRFLAFAFDRFNVYYALALIPLLYLLSLNFTSLLSSGPDQERTSSNNTSISKTNPGKDTMKEFKDSMQVISVSPKKPVVSTITQPDRKTAITPENTIQTPDSSKKMEVSPDNSIPDVPFEGQKKEPVAEKPKQKKKVVYVAQQDTIVIYDTIQATKPKRKKNK
ncbi:MAG: hypothetical protein ACJ75J_06235, partial [Cytophagaceae bacterium]